MQSRSGCNAPLDIKRMVQKVFARWKHRRFCKLNGYFCPECIYHEFVWDGIVFRGNRCQYPHYKQPTNYVKTLQCRNEDKAVEAWNRRANND